MRGRTRAASDFGPLKAAAVSESFPTADRSVPSPPHFWPNAGGALGRCWRADSYRRWHRFTQGRSPPTRGGASPEVPDG